MNRMSKVYHALLWVLFDTDTWSMKIGQKDLGSPQKGSWGLGGSFAAVAVKENSPLWWPHCVTRKNVPKPTTKYKQILTLCDTHTTSTCWRIWTIYEHRPFLRALTLLHVSLFPDSCQAMEMITPPQRNVSNVRLSDSTTDNYPQDCPP